MCIVQRSKCLKNHKKMLDFYLKITLDIVNLINYNFVHLINHILMPMRYVLKILILIRARKFHRR